MGSKRRLYAPAHQRRTHRDAVADEPPPHREYGLVGGHLIPLSRRTLLGVDAFDFEVSKSGAFSP